VKDMGADPRFLMTPALDVRAELFVTGRGERI
jgi:hypothetical protein